MSNLDASILDYLRGHRTGVLATSKKSGAPQLTLIAYQFDGTTLAISTRAPTQKAKNISVRPEVSLAVIDGSRQLIVYGAARIVRNSAEVLHLHRERIRQIALRKETDAELEARLKREDRVVILLTPRSFYPTTLS
ncbi:MAG TPA: pyridoxamine 5'-phosphate oxidase family protein [Dehalococcoidia bacterium]|nr:pyridoxamine 5'-phosphate oxidase family protein [Dehalococcoidia bacterium]